jgi:hypothetical protein
MAVREIRCLSLRQPWAWLVAEGYKDVENRTWPTRYRGLLAIHAARRVHEDYATGSRFPIPIGLTVPAPNAIERGGLVAVADLFDCVTASESPWFGGPYGFVLRNVRRLPFLPMPGRLGIFVLPPDVARRVQAAIEA